LTEVLDVERTSRGSGNPWLETMLRR